MILMVDNYDSFTYNLVQYFEEFGEQIRIEKNNRIDLEQIAQLNPEAIVLSPGPSTPQQAGVCLDLVGRFGSSIPILGVCLGHQVIAQAFGGTVQINYRLMHGKTSPIYHNGQTIFAGLSNPFMAARYHSLVVEEARMPDCLKVTARSDSGEVMGIRHINFPVEGVQFHPESILTPEGKHLLKNFWLAKNRFHSAGVK